MSDVRRMTLLLIAIFMVGCSTSNQGTNGSKQGDSPVSSPVVGSSQPPSNPSPAPAELRTQALNGLAKGDFDGAISGLQELARQTQSADDWNDLAFAFLKAKRYDEAVKAGEEALKLNHNHPYALYNVGLAKLAGTRPCDARWYLERTADLQPDRHEPLVALAEVYSKTEQLALAAYYAEQAAHLPSGKQEATNVLREIQRSQDGGQVPANLQAAVEVKLDDGPISMYLYRGQAAGCGAPHQLFLRNKGAWSQAHVGPLSGGQELTAVSFPDGIRGYWLEVTTMDAEVSHNTTWRLFVYNTGKLQQVVFTGRAGYATDSIRSPGQPLISDRLITVTHLDSASGTRRIHTEWRLSSDLGTAGVTLSETTIEGEVLEISGDKVTVAPANRFGVPQEQYKETVELTPEIHIVRSGKPTDRSVLKPQTAVRVVERDGKVQTIEVQDR